MILVDTSVWISALHGFVDDHTARLRGAVATGRVIVGDLILMEVLRGARDDTAAQRLRQQLRAFPIISLGGARVAEQSAANYRRLRAVGITVRSSIDVVIATFCIERGHLLLHKDRDFAHFERLGLRNFEA